MQNIPGSVAVAMLGTPDNSSIGFVWCESTCKFKIIDFIKDHANKSRIIPDKRASVLLGR